MTHNAWPTIPDVAGLDLGCDGVRETEPLTRDNGAGSRTLSDDELMGDTLSDRALALVNGPRAEEYAPPEVNMPRIGQMWGAMLGLEKPIPGWRVALMLAGLKLIRAAHKPGEDSLIDSVGYIEIAERLKPNPNAVWVDVGYSGPVSRG